MGMKDWRQQATTGLRSILFLRFALAPLAILLVMNSVLDIYVADVGGMAGRRVGIAQIYDRPAAPAVPVAQPASGGPSRPHAAPAPAAPAAPAIGSGRFEWMAFHLAALILYPAIGLISLLLMYRHLAWRRFWPLTVTTAAFGIYWTLKAVGNPDRLGTATGLLLSPTRVHALSHYDPAFRESAWTGVLINYGSALIVTIFVVIAAASVLHGIDRRRRLSLRRLESKRRDLRLVLVVASVLMTFIAFYVGEWLAWPARLGDPAAEEFRSVARGLRVFFGTGYTLALLGFAIPAVIALSRAIQRAKEAGPQREDDHEFLHQLVFSRDEATMLLSVLAPFLTTIIGAAVLL